MQKLKLANQHEACMLLSVAGCILFLQSMLFHVVIIIIVVCHSARWGFYVYNFMLKLYIASIIVMLL